MSKNKGKSEGKSSSKAIEIPVSKLTTKDGKPMTDLLKEDGQNSDSQTKVREVKLPASLQNEAGMRVQGDKVFVKFGRFISMIIVHDLDDVLDRYEDEEIEISTDLLIDLASSYEEPPAQLPWGYMVLGIFLGGLLTLIIAEFL